MISVPISPDMVTLFLWILFTAATALTIVVGLILSYHWLRYAMHPVVPLLAVVSYGAVSITLLAIMFAVVISL